MNKMSIPFLLLISVMIVSTEANSQTHKECETYVWDYSDHADNMIPENTPDLNKMDKMYQKAMEDLIKLELANCYRFSEIKNHEVFDKLPTINVARAAAYNRMRNEASQRLLTTNKNQSYVSGDGDEYILQYNKHGAVLTSVNEKHIMDNNAGGKVTSQKLKLYMGKDCDTFSKVYGKGSWGWANGGFSIEFKGKSFGFPRQEVDIPGMEQCQF